MARLNLNPYPYPFPYSYSFPYPYPAYPYNHPYATSALAPIQCSSPNASLTPLMPRPRPLLAQASIPPLRAAVACSGASQLLYATAVALIARYDRPAGAPRQYDPHIQASPRPSLGPSVPRPHPMVGMTTHLQSYPNPYSYS